jgi:hypothetical protein
MQMVQVPKVCPQCHIAVRATDFFCFNCGKSLKEKPKPVGILSQLILYIGCFLLPPLGFWWGFKYMRQDDSKSKMVGVVCIVLTVVALVAVFVLTQNIANTLNQQVNSATSDILGF